jgi:hypothetical protein
MEHHRTCQFDSHLFRRKVCRWPARCCSTAGIQWPLLYSGEVDVAKLPANGSQLPDNNATLMHEAMIELSCHQARLQKDLNATWIPWSGLGSSRQTQYIPLRN